jgi:hypothetical protein
MTAFLGDWFAFLFALIGSAVAAFSTSRPRAGADARPVVLLCGKGLGKGAMALLAARLRRDGRDAYLQSGGARDAERRAARFAGVLREVAQRSCADRVDVIAHGEAGIVVRSAARYHGCVDVLGNVVTLGSPHQGTALAAFLGWHALAYLRPHSRYLERLNEDDPVPASVNFTAVVSTFDAIVFPPELARCPGAMNVTLDWVGHYAMLTSERIYRLAKENIDVEPRAARDFDESAVHGRDDGQSEQSV